MDSFSYCLEDRGPLLVDDVEVPVNSLGRINNFVKDFDLKCFHDSDKNMIILDGEPVEPVESVFPLMIGEFLLGNPCLGVDNSVIKSPSTSLFSLDQFTEDLGFVSEHSDTGYNHGDKKVPLIVSENLTDTKQSYSRMSSGESLVSSLVEDSLPVKRARTTNLPSQTPLCQVQGCFKDLSSSKDYHKRHRVCDVHSKTAKVIINGIEKRFCQQCSRFHLLKEFDDVKRSCRKRLAGHNERRRKPHFYPQLGADSQLLKMDLLKGETFLLSEGRPASFYYQEKYVDDNQSKRMRLQKVPGDASQLAIDMTTGLSPQKTLARKHSNSKHNGFGAFVGAGAGKIGFTIPLGYGHAPSLLSFKSKNLPSYSHGNSEALPVSGGSYPAYGTNDKESFYRSGPSTLNSFIQNEHFPTCTRNQEGPVLYNGSTVVCSDVQTCGLPQLSVAVLKNGHSPEDGSTLDLLRLSSNLQRVEQQQKSVQVKQENFTFCCSTSAQ